MSKKSLAPKRDERPLYLRLDTSRRAAFISLLWPEYRRWRREQGQAGDERKAVA